MKAPPRTRRKLPDLNKKKPPADDHSAWLEFTDGMKKVKKKKQPSHIKPPRKHEPDAPTTDTLDLHGMSEDAAHKKLLQWLHEIESAGIRNATVITGLGRKGDGVLRRNVPRWLEDSKIISAIDTASGGGALRLRLKGKKCRK